MKLSLVVPTYNLADYIPSLLSDLSQQTQDFELWLVDDGSTDQTPAVINDFVRGVPNFYAVSLDHKGVSNARNYGLRHATGGGVAFIDGDDRIAPLFVSAMSKGLDRDTPMMSVGYEWYRRPVSSSSRLMTLDQRRMFEQVANHGTEVGGYVWNKAFLKSALTSSRLFFDTNLHIAEDYLFTASFVAKNKGPYLYLPQVLYQKRNRPGSTIHSATWADRQKEDAVFRTIRRLEGAIS